MQVTPRPKARTGWDCCKRLQD